MSERQQARELAESTGLSIEAARSQLRRKRCPTMAADSNKKRRFNNRAKGLCICGTPPRPGLKKCKKCAEIAQVQVWKSLGIEGATEEEYQRLFDEQKGLCQICGDSSSEKRRLALDHSHTTGKIRGLLCFPCNYALGLFKDSPDIMRIAAAYVE